MICAIAASVWLSGCVSADGALSVAAPQEIIDAEPRDDEAITYRSESIALEPLANDGAGLADGSIRVTRSPTGGRASIEGTTLVYEPEPDFVGADSIRYEASDGKGRAIGEAQVRVLVRPERVALPIEVWGQEEPEIALWIEEPDAIDALSMQIHKPTHRSLGATPASGAKVSVQLNGGPSVPMTPEIAQCEGLDAALGCLEGGLSTLRLSVPITSLGSPGVVAGVNRLAWSFDDAGRQSAGYRVLAVDLRARNGSALLMTDFVDRSAVGDAEVEKRDAIAGGTLWRSALEGGCGSCHTRDGHDLAYYNFSDASIIARAQIYGLSADQGVLIAAYVRSLDLGPDFEASLGGRPWDPPFQPGPSIGQWPAWRWAAGAGLGAALERDDSMREFLFKPDISPLAIRDPLEPSTLPIALPLPDWLAWLPERAPREFFGPSFALERIKIGPVRPSGLYEEARRAFSEADGSREALERGERALAAFLDGAHLAAAIILRKDDLVVEFDGVVLARVDGADLITIEGARERRASREVVARALRHWTAVRAWEITREFRLAERAASFYGSGAERRRWWTDRNTLALLAPQRTAFDGALYADRSAFASYYLSNAWNAAQLAIHAGPGRAPSLSGPVDWINYLTLINKLARRAPGPSQPYRLAASTAAMYRSRVGIDPSAPETPERALELVHPARLAPESRAGAAFATLPAPERGQVLGALAREALAFFEAVPVAAWPRRAAEERDRFEPVDYVPVDIGDQNLTDVVHRGDFADAWLSMIPQLRDAGVDAPTLERLRAYGAALWPRGAW